MTLPLDRSFSPNLENLPFEVRRMYQEFSRQINGSVEEWTPKVFGTSTAGAGTYTKQNGIYILKGCMVDVYYDVTWSAHTGSGNLYIEMPFLSNFSTVPYLGIIDNTDGGINYSSGLYTNIHTRLNPGTRKAIVEESGDSVVTQEIVLPSAAECRGCIRYPIKIDY